MPRFFPAILLALSLSVENGLAFDLFSVQVPEPPLRAQAIEQVFVVPKRLKITRPEDWPQGWGKTYYEGKYFVIDGMDRCMLDGSRLHGNMNQDEHQESIAYFYMDNLIFRRWRIVNCKESIHYYGNHQFHQDNVHVNVGEDAVSAIDTCRNLSIIGNDFAGDRRYDKIIQLNAGKGHIIQNNTFRRCMNAVRAMDAQVYSRNNQLFNVDMAYYATRKNGRITFEPFTERYENVKTMELVDGGGIVTAVGADGKKLKKK